MGNESDNLKPGIRNLLLQEIPLELQAGIPSLSTPQKKPLHWASRANAPYYKEKFALQVKEILDGMEKDRQDIIFRYDEHPKISRNTLYLRLNQSALYLVEKLDTISSPKDASLSLLGLPLYHYSRLIELLTITRERDIGVRFSFEEDGRNSELGNLKPMKVLSKLECPKWRQEMESFVDEGRPGEVFHKKGLALTPEEVLDIKTSFASLENIMAIVKPTEIKIVKKDV
jgi:hypothetical protein